MVKCVERRRSRRPCIDHRVAPFAEEVRTGSHMTRRARRWSARSLLRGNRQRCAEATEYRCGTKPRQHRKGRRNTVRYYAACRCRPCRRSLACLLAHRRHHHQLGQARPLGRVSRNRVYLQLPLISTVIAIFIIQVVHFAIS